MGGEELNILLRNTGTTLQTLSTAEKSKGKVSGLEILVGFRKEKEFSVPAPARQEIGCINCSMWLFLLSGIGIKIHHLVVD